MASISRSRVTKPAEEQEFVDGNTYSAGVPDHDDDDTPPKRTIARTSSRSVSSGWGAPKQEQRERVQAPYLKLKDNGKRIVKLLTAEPTLRYFEHFVNSTGKRFICSGKDTCALCDAGHRAGARFMMNVVDMSEPEEVATWTFGNEVAQQLQAFAEETVTSPIDRENLYFQVYHIKVEGRKAPGTKVLPVKARDVFDDYGIPVLNSEDIDKLSETLYDEETLFIWSPNKVKEAAEDLTPNDFPKK